VNSPALFVAAVLTVWFIVTALNTWLHHRSRPSRDDLMALAEATRPRCNAVGIANRPGHRMHDCDLHPGHDLLHYCDCGASWHTAQHEAAQIAVLHEMFAAQTYEPDRRYR
jgi:hypothetical protein